MPGQKIVEVSGAVGERERVNNFFKIIGFSLSLILFYTLFAVYYVPDSHVDGLGRKGRKVLLPIEEIGAVAYGEEVFYGRGGCAQCHDSAGGRAPELTDVAVRASSRVTSPEYKGEATDAIGYLFESMVKPSAFVVDGYGTVIGKKVVSPMPDVSSGTIRLNKVELAATVAYLQSVAGIDVTVKVPVLTGGVGAQEKSGLKAAPVIEKTKE